MSTSARDCWLFEILRGADLLQSPGGSRYYRPKCPIKVTTIKGQFTVRTSDQFDVSNPECIRVVRDGFGIRIPWVIVTSIQLKEEGFSDTLVYEPVETISPSFPKNRRGRSSGARIEADSRGGGRFQVLRNIGRLISSR